LEYYLDVNATLPPEKDQYFLDLLKFTWSVKSQDLVSPARLVINYI